MNLLLALVEKLPQYSPILNVGTYENETGAFYLPADHFRFELQPDPTTSIVRERGVSILPVRLVAKSEPRLAAYVIENGQSRLITDPAEVAKTTPHYIETIDIIGLCQRLGIEQFGLIRLNCDNKDRILREWPGPVSNLVYAPTEDEQALRNMKDWYRYSDGLFELAR